jgi:hypothetical protein
MQTTECNSLWFNRVVIPSCAKLRRSTCYPTEIIYLFIYRLFFNDFSVTDYFAWNERVISEWWTGKDLGGNGRSLILRYYPRIRLEELRENTKDLSQDSRSLDRGFNLDPSEYEGVLTTRPRRSVSCRGWLQPISKKLVLYLAFCIGLGTLHRRYTEMQELPLEVLPTTFRRVSSGG